MQSTICVYRQIVVNREYDLPFYDSEGKPVCMEYTKHIKLLREYMDNSSYDSV